jgi:Uma2 family endonuclease
MRSKSKVAGVLKAPRRWPVSVEAYHQMIDAGVFPPDARIELIEGELYEMPPQGLPHTVAVRWLMQLFAPLIADGRVLVQMPVYMPRSEPEPDIAVMAPGTPIHQVGIEHAVLVIEVSNRTRGFDLQRKAPLYQGHNVLETWVLDIPQRRLVVFPREGGSIVYSQGQDARITPRAVPEVTLDLDELFAALPKS